MNDPCAAILFEGTFLINGYATKADILIRKPNGWHIIEGKSRVKDSEEFIDDMAYTDMVIDSCGINISEVSLLLVSRDFRLRMENENLFIEIDHTSEVLEKVELFKPYWEQIEEITKRSSKPEPELRFECRKCELFKECLGQGVENHIFDIPRLSQSKFDRLMESGITCIEDIPDDFPLTENQDKVRKCIQTNNQFIGEGLRAELETI